MHPHASVELDKFDVANPPRFSKYVEVNFNKKDRFYSNFKADVVNFSRSHKWDLSINSHVLEKPALLKWDSEGILPNQLILIDMNSLAKIDMATQNNYYFTPDRKPEFRIVYNQYSTKINLGELRFGKPVPNPMEDRTLIGFNLPESIDNYKVSAEIIDVNGKKIKQLKNNLLNEILGVLIIMSGLILGFSKVKGEDEFIAQIRSKSLIWATYINYGILLLAIILVYDLSFFTVMVFSMFMSLVLFVLHFHWQLYKLNNKVID
jgi:hypothetical protein